MRAHSVEPALSWPTEGHRVARSCSGADAAKRGCSNPAAARAEEPMARVAALLLSISQNNRYEGRDAKSVPDALTSGFVADLVGVDIVTLAALLVDLRRRGLVESRADGALHLKDIDGLQQLVN
jgi:hypothetical protein